MKNIAYIIIAILLAVDNIFIKFKVGDISFDRLFTFLMFFVFFGAYLKEIRNNQFFRRWNVFIIVLAILQLLANLKLSMSGDLEFKYVYIFLVKSFSFVAFSFLFLHIAKRNIKYVNIILFVHFLICIFAFLQHPLSPIAGQMLEIKKLLYVATDEASRTRATLTTEEAYITGGFADRFRLAGPFGNTIGFSYFAISSFIMTFYMYLRYKKKYYLWMLIVLFAASLLTQTRSLLLAEIFLVFGYLFFAPFKRQGFYRLGIVAAALIAVLFVYSSQDILLKNSSSRITQLTSAGQTDTRPILWLTAVYAVMTNPFGISQAEYQLAREDMHRVFGHGEILHLWPHNGIINVGFHYTFFGYIVFFYLIAFLIRNINYLDKKFAVFFKMALIAYLIHTSFHNNFVLWSDYPFMMVLMLISVDYYYNPPEKEVDLVTEEENKLPGIAT